MKDLSEFAGGSFWPRIVCGCRILGEPASKERPRVTSRKGKSITYTPKKTRVAESAIAWELVSQNSGLTVDGERDFRVDVLFVSKSNRRRDIDNMIKLVLDALNGVVYEDDSQVVEIHAIIARGSAEEPRTDIIIRGK
jgi:crossover junction endodeoxyribonuclease RusA